MLDNRRFYTTLHVKSFAPVWVIACVFKFVFAVESFFTGKKLIFRLQICYGKLSPR